MTLYNNIVIPYHLRIDRTQVTEVSDNTGNREAEEWGVRRVNHPEQDAYHLQDEKDKEE